MTRSLTNRFDSDAGSMSYGLYTTRFFNYKKIIIDTHTYIDTHTQTIKDSYGART
jgi:hypothetical protein